MPSKSAQNAPSRKKSHKLEKRADALRENLMKRKQQVRAREKEEKK